MEINRINSTQVVGINLKKQPQKVNFTGLREDTFEKSFSPEKTMEALSEVKERGGKNKFHSPKIVNEIKTALVNDPRKCEFAQNLAYQDNISQKGLKDILTLPYDSAKDVSEIATKKNNRRILKFSTASEVAEVTKMKPEDIKRVKQLIDTPLKSKDIINVVKEPTKIDCEKLVGRINDLVKTLDRDNLDQVTFARDDFAKGEYTLTGIEKEVYEDEDDEEGEADVKTVFVKTETFDKNLNMLAIDTKKGYKTRAGKEYEIRKVKDIKNNTTAKTRYEKNPKGRLIVTHEVRIIKDKDGKTLRTEYTEPSDIKGMFNIKHMMPNGEVKQISSAKVDPKTGITTVKKDMTSPLGVRTQYLYEDDPQGNRIIDYKITDKKGNVILNNSESFEVVNSNKFISSKNGHKYEMTVAEDGMGLTVKDLEDPKRTATFSSSKNISGKQDQILNVLKQMPGEELLKLNKATKELVGINDVLKSYASSTEKTRKIVSGNDLFVILHELGHARDDRDVDVKDKKNTLKNALFKDKEFSKIYTKEKNAFNKAYPDAQRNHISYFINHESHYLGKGGGKQETVAEANALLSTPKSHEVFGIRSQYLQQNFPETIAYLDKKLNND